MELFCRQRVELMLLFHHARLLGAPLRAGGSAGLC